MNRPLSLLACCLAFVAFGADAETKPEILTVYPDGSFSNTNVVGNLAGFAEAKARSEMAQAIADAAHTAATNTEKIVRDGIAEVQAGAKIEYSDLFAWSAGAFSLSTNASCVCYKIILQDGIATNIDGVAHFAVDVKYRFSEDIGSYQPGVKYSTNLNATNSWVMCVQDDPIGPYRDTTVTPAVDNAYMTRNWLPVSLKTAFFKAFVDSQAPGTGTTIDIVGRIKGGFTGQLVFQLVGGMWLYITCDGGVVTDIHTSEVSP